MHRESSFHTPWLNFFFFLCILHLYMPNTVTATVYLVNSDNATFAFEDADSAFGGIIPSTGISGILVAANPLDGCDPISPITSGFLISSSLPYFALIERGGCVFDQKVKNAQDAGYAAAIVFNDETGFELITSYTDTDEISIPSVFVTHDSGQQILSLISEGNCECFISPTFDNTAWSVMAVSFMSLLAVSAVLATFFFVRRHRLRQLGTILLAREHAGMSEREVKALPVCVFENVASLHCGTSETCAICLEDYESGDKLRILPCKHEFHVSCVDQWLTTRRPFCPVCKRDARLNAEQENFPLLSDEPESEPQSAAGESPVGDQEAQTSGLLEEREAEDAIPVLVTIDSSEPSDQRLANSVHDHHVAHDDDRPLLQNSDSTSIGSSDDEALHH